MGWEKYISEETLHTATLLELQQIKEDLQKEQERRNRRFISYKEWVYEEYVDAFSWYRQRYSISGNAKEIEEQLKLDITASTSVQDIVEAVRMSISNLEKSPELLRILESKYSHMCLKGYLPRNFIIQVRPQIIILAQECYLQFLDKNEGIFLKTNEDQMMVFENLITDLMQVTDEEDTKRLIQTTIEGVDKLIQKRTKHVLWFLDDTWNNLLLSLRHFKQQLNLEGYTRENKIFTDDSHYLQEAIYNLETQIELKQLDINEQIKRLKYYHEMAFEKVKHTRIVQKNVNIYILNKERDLKRLADSVSKSTEENLGGYQKLYAKFWNTMTEDCIQFARTVSPHERREVRILLDNLFEARKYLQKLPGQPKNKPETHYLNVHYIYDKQFLILEKYEQHINKAYKKTIGGVGKIRQQQLQQLHEKMIAARNADEVAKITHATLAKIESDHQERSLSFNVAVLRRPSRSEIAIKSFLQECERENLLPAISSPKPCTVELVFARAIDEYFSTDLWMSSRSRRKISRKLLEGIHKVNEQVEENKIMLIEGKKQIAGIVDCAIVEAEKIHKEGEGFTRVLRLIGYKGHSRFVNCLKRSKENLLSKKHLETDYEIVIWPEVYARLEQTIAQYQNSMAAEHTQVVEGVKDAKDLALLLKSATDAEHACYMLHVGISSLETGFPELASKLHDTYQSLRKDGILPIVSHTEFSKHMRDKVKQQAKEVVELKNRLRLIQ